MNYYTSKETIGGYRSRIYTYSPDGKFEKTVWQSECEYNSAEDAEDAAIEYADEHGIEIELG